MVRYTLGRVNKGRLKPAHLPLQTSNKLLQREEQREISITLRLCRCTSTNYPALLLWRSEMDQRLQRCPYFFMAPASSTWHVAERRIWSHVPPLSSSLHLGETRNSFQVRSESQLLQKVTAEDDLSVFSNELASPRSICSITVDTDPYKQSRKC